MKNLIARNHKISHKKYNDRPIMLLRMLVVIVEKTICSTKITVARSVIHSASISPPIVNVAFRIFN